MWKMYRLKGGIGINSRVAIGGVESVPKFTDTYGF
jgi:hypothetical protein